MGSQYSPVVLNNPRGGAEGENHGIYGRVKGVGWSVLPFVSSVLYLADVVSSICYAVVLFVHADDRDVVNRQLNFRLWGACIIVEHVLSGIFINGIATFYRNDMKTMNNKTKAVEIVKCFFIPEYHVLLALYRHIESTVSGSVSVNAVEWAAFTRLLQAMVEAIPQAIIQSYFFFVDFMPKDTEFASSIPVASMCLSMFNAAFGYTFFVVYKYYDQMREYPPFWQCLLVALASLFILGRPGTTPHSHNTICEGITTPREAHHNTICEGTTTPRQAPHNTICEGVFTPREVLHNTICEGITTPRGFSHSTICEGTTTPRQAPHNTICEGVTTPSEAPHNTICEGVTTLRVCCSTPQPM